MSVELKVSGQIYGGWKTCKIERGIEQIAGTFDLAVSDLWPGQDIPRPIRRGDRCEVLVDGETIITGWVDDANPECDAETHGFNVSGRDVTGDLVDCSAIHKSGQWLNATLDKIVRDICAPYDIHVVVETNVGTAFKTHSIQEGESAFECIERACRMKAVLPVSDGYGRLVLTRAKDTVSVANLVEGTNILTARGEFGMKERFSRYVVKGQDRGSDDDENPEAHAQVKAEATDDFVTRYRPLVVLAEDHGPQATYKQRAEWERNVRRGRSSRATVTVQGWRSEAGELWHPNTIVRLKSPSLGVDADLLVVTATFSLNEQGTRTELKLSGREAFDLIAGKKMTGLEGRIRERQEYERTGRKSADQDWSTF